eukprot:116105-Hanusia_phi.AAC.2
MEKMSEGARARSMAKRPKIMLMMLIIFMDCRVFAKSFEMSPRPEPPEPSRRTDNKALHSSGLNDSPSSQKLGGTFNGSLAPQAELESKLEEVIDRACFFRSGKATGRMEGKIPGLVSVTRASDTETPTKKKSDIARLRKKFWLEVNRKRNATEAYPDVEAEQAMKRVARKTVVNALNLLATKKFEEDKQKLLQASAPKPMITDGKKSLGFKGNERFKPVEMDAGGKPKKEKKRKPEDELIKLFGEFLRDKAKIQALRNQKKDLDNPFLFIRRETNRRAREVEREQLQEFLKAEEERKRSRTSKREKDASAKQMEIRSSVSPRGSNAKRSSSMRLRGGGDVTSELQLYMPWSYPSISSWIFAVIKMLSMQLFRRLGFASAKGSQAAAAAAAAAVAQQKSVPSHVREMMSSVSMDSAKLKGLKGRRVLVVTNNAVFKESDIRQVFFEGQTRPQLIESAKPILMHLAASTDLFLLTQFPHSGHETLTSYMENHTEVNETFPHGSWKDDECEGVIVDAFKDAGICDAGLNSSQILFCETVEGRGYVGRVLGEFSSENQLALMVDDNPESIGWYQNVCLNTTMIAIATPENQGKFHESKKTLPPIIVSSLEEYFLTNKS